MFCSLFSLSAQKAQLENSNALLVFLSSSQFLILWIQMQHIMLLFITVSRLFSSCGSLVCISQNISYILLQLMGSVCFLNSPRCQTSRNSAFQDMEPGCSSSSSQVLCSCCDKPQMCSWTLPVTVGLSHRWD